MLLKQKSLSLLKNLTFDTFSELPILFLTKIPSLSNSLEVLSFVSDKAKLLKTFLGTLILIT